MGTCGTCGKSDMAVQRKYYRYPIKCTCCDGADDDHFEIAYHCSGCEPKPPKTVTAYIEPYNKDKNIIGFVLTETYPGSPAEGATTDDTFSFYDGFGELQSPGLKWYLSNSKHWSPVYKEFR